MTAVAYSYGTWRSHAKGSITWADLQPTKGSYTGSGTDQAAMVISWTEFDSVMAEADAEGVGICFNLYRTPTWASRAADQVGGSNTVVGAWGDAGESAVPEKLQYLIDIIAAVLQRANATRRRITHVEPLNEPEFFTAPELAAYIAIPRKPFWTGTAPQAVDYCWAVYQATKAYDPTIPVLMPAQYVRARMDLFFNATGTVSGKKGWEVCDWLNIHPYGSTPNQAMGGYDIWNVTSITSGIADARRSLAASGCPVTKPIAITEWGLSSGTAAVVTNFNAAAPAVRFEYLSRLFAMAALNGVQLFVPFSYNAVPIENSLAGNFTDDTTGCIAAMTDVHNKLSGQTIVAGGYEPETGVVRVRLANGSSYVW
jgi:hypothetical protein